jgi:hypothetical protein
MGLRGQSRFRVALCVARSLSVSLTAGAAAANTKAAGIVSAVNDPSTNASPAPAAAVR